MKYIAAYLLANLGGNESPSAKDLTSILSSVGIESDSSMIKKVIAELSGQDVELIIQKGSSKLASIPSGSTGSGNTHSAGNSGAAAQSQQAAAPKEEEKEESDDDMGFGLFD